MKKFFIPLLAFVFIAQLLPAFAFAADTTPPAAPRGFDANGGSTAYEMVLTWTNPADTDLDHINVYFSTNAGYYQPQVFATVAASPNTKGTYTISNLSSTTTYYLYLAAVDTSGNISAYTTELKRTTASLADKTSPAAITDLAAKDAATNGAINLSWTNSADDDFFQVHLYRALTSGFTPDSSNEIAVIFGLPSSAGTYADTGLVNGTTYYYEIRPEDNRGNIQTGAIFTYGAANATPTKAPVVSPAITSISPSSGGTGISVSIQGSGFTSTGNNIHFGVGGIKNVSSPDGAKLVFTVPSAVSACDFVDVGCMAPSQEVVPGDYSLYVQNANGQSNAETFTVLATPAPPVALVDINGNAIVDGDTIKTADNADVYIIKLIGTKKFRRLILSPAVFDSYGQLSWSKIKTVSQDVMNAYTVSTLVIEVNPDGSVANPKVFSLTSAANSDTGQKQWLNMTAAQFESKGYDWDSIYNINYNEFGIYVQGSDITG